MVDIRSEVNRELVMQLVSDVGNGNRFYTDLNGFQVSAVYLGQSDRFDLCVLMCIDNVLIIDWFQMQQRRTLEKLPLQANFYPMTSAAFLQDATSRVTLLSAQSQGVGALRPGDQSGSIMSISINQDQSGSITLCL